MEAKRTPLYEMHARLNGRFVEFGGWALPVQYTSIIKEHTAVREAAGLFDISHMGALDVYGSGAAAFLDEVLTNDIATLPAGRARYALMCNEHGGTVDDIVTYRLEEDRFRLVVNAANAQKDFSWLQAHCPADAEVADRSDDFALLALQGPRSSEILRAAGFNGPMPARNYAFAEDVRVSGVVCMAARTGYTGELGFELFCAPEDAPPLWDALSAAGGALGLTPCGLGARDTLRMEAGMPLYGHELSEDISPMEAGLHAFVDFNKPYFIGRDALQRPARRRRIGFEMTERGIARAGCGVLDDDGCEIGYVTSGGYCPTLDKAMGMALVESARAEEESLMVRIRDRLVRARVAALPFYRRSR